ncbi:MAG TPA: OmpA family protein [Nevskia sp.]|jgi:peptidoglycan-associated lipoprotein|nr:OmpA family protein [Nevskia sp.]
MHIHARSRGRVFASAAVTAAVLLSGCHYVKEDEYNTTVGGLRRDVDANKAAIAANRSDLASLRSDMDARFQKYDAQISQLQGRMRVDVAAHFDYKQAALRDVDKPVLDDFAAVIHKHNQSVLVTVEGFADAKGSAPYNQRLGLQRARAVRDYLVQNGGLSADQVRAVSYGKARNRQVVAGAWGEKGALNRRVSLVIDDTGNATANGMVMNPADGAAGTAGVD